MGEQKKSLMVAKIKEQDQKNKFWETSQTSSCCVRDKPAKLETIDIYFVVKMLKDHQQSIQVAIEKKWRTKTQSHGRML
jgi:uncharacterized protein (DUF305 family)